jgi:CDP-glucose 4,6-dehydratase
VSAAIDHDFWAGRRVLVTGHTGFKGAWLSLWLGALGARVTGLAPGPPTSPSLYELARVGEGMSECAVDVRDARAVRDAVARERPEIVLHLAAQPLVRLSYREPALTYEVNVMGTVNVLEAVRDAGGAVRAVVVVTSDKCYENPAGGARRFVEGDPLGGEDPYSSSKACAELVTAAYRASFFAAGASGAPGTAVASARAGNVIGGGDWGADRLIPDIVRAVEAGEPVKVRNPGAVRPWQHVLNPLSGYLALARGLCRASEESGRDAPAAGGRPPSDGVPEGGLPEGGLPERGVPEGGLLEGGLPERDLPERGLPERDLPERDLSESGPLERALLERDLLGCGLPDRGLSEREVRDVAGAWNFGPAAADVQTVGWVVQRLAEHWGGAFAWEVDGEQGPPEAGHLALDSSRAARELDWHPAWDLDRALESVARWHEAFRRGADVRQTTVSQIGQFDQVAR